MSRNSKRIMWAIGALVLILLPLYVNPYYQSVLVFILLYAVTAIGLGLLMGFAGQISLGQTGFMAIGGYTSALLSVNMHLSPWLGMFCGAILSGLVAYILGKPMLRLSGWFLALATAAFGIIVFEFIGRAEWAGGHDGIPGVPRFSIGSFVLYKDHHIYYLLLIIVSACFILGQNIIRSKIGRAMLAIDVFKGGNETAAATSGIDIQKVKTQIFVIAAVYASISGSVYAHYNAHILPGPFDAWYGILLVLMVFMGGYRSLWGPIIGSVAYILIKEIISTVMGEALKTGWDVVIFSLVFIFILFFLPNGLIDIPNKIRQWRGK